MSTTAPGVCAPKVSTGPLAAGAILILRELRTPMTAPQLVAELRARDALRTTAKDPARSLNRDLHRAARLAAAPVAQGPARGTFTYTSEPAQDARPPAPAPRAPRAPRLPVEPLAARLESWDAVTLSPNVKRAWYRARANGFIDIYAADEICVNGLNLHPALIWGAGWWDALEA